MRATSLLCAAALALAMAGCAETGDPERDTTGPMDQPADTAPAAPPAPVGGDTMDTDPGAGTDLGTENPADDTGVQDAPSDTMEPSTPPG